MSKKIILIATMLILIYSSLVILDCLLKPSRGRLKIERAKSMLSVMEVLKHLQDEFSSAAKVDSNIGNKYAIELEQLREGIQKGYVESIFKIKDGIGHYSNTYLLFLYTSSSQAKYFLLAIPQKGSETLPLTIYMDQDGLFWVQSDDGMELERASQDYITIYNKIRHLNKDGLNKEDLVISD